MVSHYDNETFNEKYRDIFHNIKDLKEIKVSTLLLNYLIETQKRDLEHLQMIEEINNQDFMTMDLYTKKSLELTENSKDHEKYGSLFWLLDMTKSAMGARLLKNYIDRPLLKKEAIEERLDIVEIFTQQFIQRESIKEILKEIYDLERLSSRIAFGNINARDLKWIASSLKVLPELKQQLYSFNEPLTDQLANQIIDLSHITKLIDDAIIDNPPLTIKEGNIIKNHFNEELDELRYLRDHGKQWLVDFEQKEREKTGIKNLKVGYNRVFGYYIEVTKGSLDLVKDEFEYTRKQSLSNAERFITPELKDMESKILSAQDKIQKLEYVLFTQVRNEIKKEVHLIQDVSKIIARVDLYQSLKIKKIENNGDRNELNLDALFDKEFELYPGESTQGRIAFWGETVCSSAFPKIDINVQYKKGVTGKLVNMERTVIFSPSYDNKIYGDFNIDLRELNKNMNVMAKANLRTANYLDGCQVAPFDELNILAHRSLHDDLQSVKDGENTSTVMERLDVIKNRS